MERKKNSTIEMSAARIATMMEESGGGETSGDVPLVKVSRALSIVYEIHGTCSARPNSNPKALTIRGLS